jgi:adenylate cyclase
VIEGSVRRQGETLRVTAQLIEAEEGFHLWSQTFDRDTGDALAIQSEIAAAVADKLRLSVLPAGNAVRPLDGTMQQQYLEALGLIRENSHGSLARAVELLRPIRQARPDFIPVYLPLADSVQRLGWYGLLPWHEAVEEMRTLSAEASRRAPGDLDARVLAALVPFAENDLAPTYDGYERILRAHRTLADEAPNHPLLQLNTSDAARILDQHEVAIRYAERYVALEPRDPKGHMTLGQIARALGRNDEAIAAYRRGTELAPVSSTSTGNGRACWYAPADTRRRSQSPRHANAPAGKDVRPWWATSTAFCASLRWSLRAKPPVRIRCRRSTWRSNARANGVATARPWPGWNSRARRPTA